MPKHSTYIQLSFVYAYILYTANYDCLYDVELYHKHLTYINSIYEVREAIKEITADPVTIPAIHWLNAHR